MKRLLGIGVLTACILLAGGANAAFVKVGNLVLTADGGFTPRKLPRHTYVPIDFRGDADLRSTDGSVPAALQQAVLDFDRDGRLTSAGLPVCQPQLLADATPAEARNRCHASIVGSGHVGAMITVEGGSPVTVSSPLTLFNGPAQEGHPTAILHARITVPAVQTFVITIPIEKRRGGFRYRATVDVPPIAGGRGSLTHLDVKIGRRYSFHGTKRSYVAARCGSGILRTHGRFTFADGTVIDGNVEKACTPR